ncbi:hypothetical protein [Sphaerotilus mobilis]|uniref:hypothetical protein n=1 Tax=Sphaerotilus mobilis TaxID=47994 RepID=UPI001A931ACF|nr:hypothetical protein [Sphaerotilus mobilis]
MTFDGRRTSTRTLIRDISHQLAQHTPRRIELHYADRSDTRIDPPAVQRAIVEMVREHGWRDVELAIRPHRLPLDQATGDHLLRLHWLEEDGTFAPMTSHHRPEGAPTNAAAWWRTLWSRRPSRERLNLATDADATAPAPASSGEAVRLLRAAVQRAALDLTPESSLPNSRPVVRHLVAKVRDAALAQALRPYFTGESLATSQAMSRWLVQDGCHVPDPLTVELDSRAIANHGGTFLVDAADLIVTLKPSREPLATGLTATSVPRSEPSKRPALDLSTALPAGRGDATPDVQLTWVGTLDGRFEHPVPLPSRILPMRIDRELLSATMPALHKPALLAVASQKQPLQVLRNAQGRIVLKSPRSESGRVPLYRLHPGFEPLPEELLLMDAPVMVVVNDPSGVLHPITGERLPALLIEVRPGLAKHTARTSSPSPMP